MRLVGAPDPLGVGVGPAAAVEPRHLGMQQAPRTCDVRRGAWNATGRRNEAGDAGRGAARGRHPCQRLAVTVLKIAAEKVRKIATLVADRDAGLVGTVGVLGLVE